MLHLVVDQIKDDGKQQSDAKAYRTAYKSEHQTASGGDLYIRTAEHLPATQHHDQERRQEDDKSSKQHRDGRHSPDIPDGKQKDHHPKNVVCLSVCKVLRRSIQKNEGKGDPLQSPCGQTADNAEQDRNYPHQRQVQSTIHLEASFLHDAVQITCYAKRTEYQKRKHNTFK